MNGKAARELLVRVGAVRLALREQAEEVTRILGQARLNDAPPELLEDLEVAQADIHAVAQIVLDLASRGLARCVHLP